MFVHQFIDIFHEFFEKHPFCQSTGQQRGDGHLDDFQADGIFFELKPELTLFRQTAVSALKPRREESKIRAVSWVSLSRIALMRSANSW